MELYVEVIHRLSAPLSWDRDCMGAGMKKEHVSENSIMIYDDVMYPDNVTYEHIGEISIS
jgi:hypothetical protein